MHNSNNDARLDEVDAVFSRSLGIIHSTLISYYRLTEEDATEAEEDLKVWFRRLGRRGGAAQIPAKALRLSLLSAACQYGRSFQLWRLGGAVSADPRLSSLLAKEPQDVATDLVRRLDEEL